MRRPPFLTTPLAVIFADPNHSLRELREIIVRHSINNRLILVCFSERPEETVRVFSARPLTRRERTEYEETINK
jgi:uncharacterized DUF497 family protein